MTYQISREIYVRSLGFIFFIAFASFWVQIDGLIGSNGILPFQLFLERIENYYGAPNYWAYPTFSYLFRSDAFLHIQCGLGCLAALLVILRIAPAINLLIIWMLYLSLSVVGQVFLYFQWDILLLEIALSSFFFASWRLLPKRNKTGAVPTWGIWLLWILLFKLMFLSGIVKLLSQDVVWWDLTALDYHYFTQPLPNVVSWYVAQLPSFFHQIAVAITFIIELIVPFFILIGGVLKHFSATQKIGRWLHYISFFSFTFLMLMIFLTGNYNFFNLLTIVLSIPLLDDSFWVKRKTTSPVSISSSPLSIYKNRLIILPISFILIISGLQFYAGMASYQSIPQWGQKLMSSVQGFRTINNYGLFRVMTKTRPEIIIQGSYDGENWVNYDFKYKADDLSEAPCIIAPHQPRLDWQMWFAALGTYDRSPWMYALMLRLLEGSPSVLGLFNDNPFPNAPPNYCRALLYDYNFTNFTEKKEEGHWWKRTFIRPYSPIIESPQN